MRVLFMGTSEYSLAVLKRIFKEHEIVMVVTKPDAQVGRKKTVVFPKVKEFAIEKGIEVFQPQVLAKQTKKVLALDYDCLVTAAYGQYIPTSILKKGKYLPLNAHASLLPKYRGGSPIQTAIKNGENYLGVSIMEMVKEMDAGRICLQEKIPLLNSDTGESMFAKLGDLASDLMSQALKNIEHLTFKEQDSSKVTYAPNIKRIDEELNFKKTAREVFNHIRAYYNNPLTYTKIKGKYLKVFQAKIVKSTSEADCGTIIDLSESGILVKCKTDALLLTVIQLEGKKKMAVKDFINGNRLINIGDKFEGDKNE